MKYLLTFSFIILSVLAVWAQTAVPVAPLVPPELGWLQTAIQSITAVEASGWIGVLTFVTEAGLRLIKTEKPRSILYLVADGVKMGADLLGKIGNLLDKILPQRIS